MGQRYGSECPKIDAPETATGEESPPVFSQAGYAPAEESINIGPVECQPFQTGAGCATPGTGVAQPISKLQVQLPTLQEGASSQQPAMAAPVLAEDMARRDAAMIAAKLERAEAEAAMEPALQHSTGQAIVCAACELMVPIVACPEEAISADPEAETEEQKLQNENTRLNHRIEYLEDQVAELENGMKAVRDSLAHTLNTEIQDTITKLDAIGKAGIPMTEALFQKGGHVAHVKVPMAAVLEGLGGQQDEQLRSEQKLTRIQATQTA